MRSPVVSRRRRFGIRILGSVGLLFSSIFAGAQTCDVSSLVTFTVESAVAAQHAEEVKEGIALADAYFREVFGRTVCIRVTVRVLAGTAEQGVAGVFGVDLIQVGTGHVWWRTSERHSRIKVLVHEYFHVFQNELSRSRGAPANQVRPDGPAWLREGSAELIAWRAVDWKGWVPFNAVRADMIRFVKGAPPVPLSSMETLQSFRMPRFPANELGVLAVEFLTRGTGIVSLARFYEDTARSPWPQSFEKTFGRRISDFYKEFEEYRKTF